MMKWQHVHRRAELEATRLSRGRRDHKVRRGDHAVGREVVLGKPEAVKAQLLRMDHLLQVLLEELMDVALVGFGHGREDTKLHCSPPDNAYPLYVNRNEHEIRW